MDNMKIYNLAKPVPPEAQKPITAGRLKGMTDINPMWRLKRLTEMFGPCGVGWWYEITDKQIVSDEVTGQKAAFVDVNLYFVDAESGVVSKPIPGTGGSAFVSNERNGPYLSDECFKMALTDALSVACKAIGIAADIYYAKDRDKYTAPEEEPKAVSHESFARAREKAAAEAESSSDFIPTCAECGEKISDKVHDFSVKKYGKPLCMKCQGR